MHIPLNGHTPAHLCISWLFQRIDMPDDIIRQSINPIPCPLRHLGKALGLSLVLERIAREIDPRSMHIRFENNVDTADAVKRYPLILIFFPVSHFGHVFAVRVVLFVAFSKDHVFGKGGGEFETFWGFLPGIVVDWVVLVMVLDRRSLYRMKLTSSFNIDHLALLLL